MKCLLVIFREELHKELNARRWDYTFMVWCLVFLIGICFLALRYIQINKTQYPTILIVIVVAGAVYFPIAFLRHFLRALKNTKSVLKGLKEEK